jgi:uncharacterized membrane protein
MKLKDFSVDNISLTKKELPTGNVFNVKYNNEYLEFQTPKMIIESLIKQNEKEYIVLKILGNVACKTFCTKVKSIEEYFEKMFGYVQSVFENEFVTIKVPIKFSKPMVKIHKNDMLFNYYHLAQGMEIICFVTIDKVWVTESGASYHLNVKEIMVIDLKLND